MIHMIFLYYLHLTWGCNTTLKRQNVTVRTSVLLFKYDHGVMFASSVLYIHGHVRTYPQLSLLVGLMDICMHVNTCTGIHT